MSSDADTVDASADLTLAGETLELRADRSVFWPGASTLFVADTHFGKAGVFRRQGLGVPSGTTAADLKRLAAALFATQAQRLVVLGDFVHAPPAADAPWLADFAAWRARHSGVEIIVTRGNHDRASQLPVDLDVDWRAGAMRIGPFICKHEPDCDSRGPVLAGHIHPAVCLRDGGERVRLPVFHCASGGLVLPAFCSFAGSANIRPAPDDRVFVIAGDNVFALDKN